MADLTLLSIAELSKGFNNKEFSSTEVTKAYIENMEKGRKYNAFITETAEHALKQALESDKRISKGETRKPDSRIPSAKGTQKQR